MKDCYLPYTILDKHVSCFFLLLSHYFCSFFFILRFVMSPFVSTTFFDLSFCFAFFDHVFVRLLRSFSLSKFMILIIFSDSFFFFFIISFLSIFASLPCIQLLVFDLSCMSYAVSVPYVMFVVVVFCCCVFCIYY